MVDVIIRLLMALEAIVCLLLIGIILLQRSKGQGVGLSFGGGAAESVFGGQMGNVLTRTTVILAFVFLVNTTVLAILKPKGASASVVDRIAEPAAEVADTSAPIPTDADIASALESAPVAPEAAAPAPDAAEAAPAPAAEAAPAPAAEAATPAPAAEAAAAPAPAAEAAAVPAPAAEAAPAPAAEAAPAPAVTEAAPAGN